MNCATHGHQIRFRDNTAPFSWIFHHVHHTIQLLNLEHLRKLIWRSQRQPWFKITALETTKFSNSGRGPFGKLKEWTVATSIGGVEWNCRIFATFFSSHAQRMFIVVNIVNIHHGEIFHSKSSLRRPNWQKNHLRRFAAKK